MRVLLDENLPKRLGGLLEAEAVTTVGRHGWSGIKNGELLALAQREFDVMVTMDKGIEYQQNLAGIEISLVVLKAVSNDLEDLEPLVPAINAALPGLRPGQVAHLGTYGRSSK